MYKIIEVALRAHHVKRWNGVNIIGHRRSISEHSFEVAMLAKNIVECLRKDLKWDPLCDFYLYLKSNVLEYSLTHDLAETVTGDISYVTKRDFPALKQELNKVEDAFNKRFGFESDKFHDNVKLIVKTADTIAVAIEITEQIKLGNSDKDFTMRNVEDIIYYSIGKYSDTTDTKIYNYCKSLLEEVKPWTTRQ